MFSSSQTYLLAALVLVASLFPKSHSFSNTHRRALPATRTKLNYADPTANYLDRLVTHGAAGAATTVAGKSDALLNELSGFVDMCQLIDGAGEDQVSVVFFHASYCRKCKQVMPRYQKLASVMANSNVRFAALESSSLVASDLKLLGIDRFPIIQVWRNGERIASTRGALAFQQNRLKSSIESCFERTMEDWEEFKDENQLTIAASVQALLHFRQPVAFA